MATTSPDNIYSPNIDDNWAVPQAMGALADSVQEALSRRANLYVGSSQERMNFVPDSVGVHWQDTDEGKKEFLWDGSKWTLDKGVEILWESASLMRGDQTAPLSSPVLSQPTGIVLAWSRWAGGGQALNNEWNFQFVPKYQVMFAPGTGVTSVIGRGYSSTIAQKYVYVANTRLIGHDFNNTSPNNQYVLRYVAGV